MPCVPVQPFFYFIYWNMYVHIWIPFEFWKVYSSMLEIQVRYDYFRSADDRSHTFLNGHSHSQKSPRILPNVFNI